jgi:hypothetical protein
MKRERETLNENERYTGRKKWTNTETEWNERLE